MFNRLSKENCFYGLDIGAHKIKACALRMQEAGESEIVGIVENDTQGFGDNSVTDLHELSESIHRVIEKLVQKTGVKAKGIQLGVNGDLVFVRPTSTMIPLVDRGHKIISKKDLKKVNHHARLLGIKMEEEIIHDLPTNYTVDDANEAINPLGLYGRTLGVQALLIGTQSNTLRNITKAIHQAGYDVEHVFFNSYAAASLVLTEAQRIGGVALIDIGSKVTSVLVFKDNVLKHVGIIHIGGDHFTKSIANQINLPFDLAEEIKKSYALAIGSAQLYEEEILVKKENTYIPIKREIICQAIEPCVSELIGSIHESLNTSNYFHHINQGLVLIGGGALLPGLIECVGEKTNCTAQLGKIRAVSHKNIGKAALYSSVVGLALRGMEEKKPKAVSSNGEVNWAKNALNRVVELYNEYF